MSDSSHSTRPPRYSDEPLPARRYLPGRGPRPRDASGGEALSWASRFEEDLGECGAYRYGVDLFNASFYWEAHEAWEEVWQAAGPKSPLGVQLRGLIQMTAALLKVELDEPIGARRLAARASSHLVGASQSVFGFDVGALSRRVARYIDEPDPANPPRILLDRVAAT